MKRRKISFRFKKKKITLDVFECNSLEMGKGLMFSRREKAKSLLFNFDKPNRELIHSLFVFFPFVAVWLDKRNKVIDLKIVRPFRLGVRPKKSFSKIVEIPINVKYRRQTKDLKR